MLSARTRLYREPPPAGLPPDRTATGRAGVRGRWRRLSSPPSPQADQTSREATVSSGAKTPRRVGETRPQDSSPTGQPQGGLGSEDGGDACRAHHRPKRTRHHEKPQSPAVRRHPGELGRPARRTPARPGNHREGWGPRTVATPVEPTIASSGPDITRSHSLQRCEDTQASWGDPPAGLPPDRTATGRAGVRGRWRRLSSPPSPQADQTSREATVSSGAKTPRRVGETRPQGSRPTGQPQGGLGSEDGGDACRAHHRPKRTRHHEKPQSPAVRRHPGELGRPARRTPARPATTRSG